MEFMRTRSDQVNNGNDEELFNFRRSMIIHLFVFVCFSCFRELLYGQLETIVPGFFSGLGNLKQL